MNPVPCLPEDCSARQGPALRFVTCVNVFGVTQASPTPDPFSTRPASTHSLKEPYFPLPHADS